MSKYWKLRAFIWEGAYTDGHLFARPKPPQQSATSRTSKRLRAQRVLLSHLLSPTRSREVEPAQPLAWLLCFLPPSRAMRYLPVSPFSSRPSAESSLGALCDFSILQFVEISPSARVPARRSSPSNIVGGNCGFGRARDTILQFIRMTYLLTLIFFFVLRLCRCVCLLPFTLQPKKEISSKRKKKE